MPQARIMEFHYPQKSDDPKLIQTTAEHFLKSLSDHRSSPNRPVVFVAHGTGGLILERALVLDSTNKSTPQLLRSRQGNPSASQDAQAKAPEEGLPPALTRKKSQPHRLDWHNPPEPTAKRSEDDSEQILPPTDLHELSLVAGIIFLETSICDPDGMEHFHREFAVRVIVEWDIPVHWYRSKIQTKREIFDFKKSAFKAIPNSQKDHGTPTTLKLSTFPQEGVEKVEGSLNKFSNPRDENYSMVRRNILSMFKNDQFLQAAYKIDVAELVDILKLHRIDPNEPKRYGYSALHIASSLGDEHTGTVDTLLENNANITAKTQNRDGKTALRIAVENNHLSTVNLLLDKGALTDPQDNETAPRYLNS
jgi:hypothetical protein